jgi:hypothetical protein
MGMVASRRKPRIMGEPVYGWPGEGEAAIMRKFVAVCRDRIRRPKTASRPSGPLA